MQNIAFKPGPPSDEKLRELILYLACRSEGDSSFGSVKLNKLLFFADFLGYLHHGQAITWQPYVKQPFGPAPQRMAWMLDRMQEDDLLTLRQWDYHGLPQKKPIAGREADLSLFTAAEIALVDQLIGDYWSVTATRISNQSHEFVGWQLAELDELIPYPVARVGSREPTPDEIAYGRTLESIAQGILAQHAR